MAYYLHWQHDQIMEMSHKDRRRWCQEVSRINAELSGEPENVFEKI